MINRILSLSVWLAMSVMALTSCSSKEDEWVDDEIDEPNVVTISIADDGSSANLPAGSQFSCGPWIY